MRAKSSRKSRAAIEGNAMLRCAVLVLVSLVAGSARAQQTPPPAETASPSPSAAAKSNGIISMEEPQPGDYWNYEKRDEITGKIAEDREIVVTEVTPENISVRVKIVGASDELSNVFDHSWNLLSSTNWRYSPYQGSTGIQAPLVVGKIWVFQSSSVSANGVTWKESGTSKVVAQETLSTKAGTFETFKIEINFSSQNVKDPTRKNETALQSWYAPMVDHWVKRTMIVKSDNHLRSNDTWELVDYGRKQ
jgi:hypothetical protein